jgi:hypothetical protein
MYVITMSNAIEEKNKELVLEALDTLFNKHDYVAAGKVFRNHFSAN